MSRNTALNHEFGCRTVASELLRDEIRNALKAF